MKNKIVTICCCLVCLAGMLVFEYANVTIVANQIANDLANQTISRLFLGGALVTLCLFLGYKHLFTHRNKPFWKAIVWCLPCLLVCLANFPFSALIKGTATITHPNLVWLFVLNCIAVAAVEELLFRGIVLQTALLLTKNRTFVAILAQSAIFALVHLFNLFAGADVGATFLQVGYTFLIGVMLSFVVLRTGNLWIAILLHTTFNVGGQIVERLGSGAFQDTTFWILTALCGTLCALHLLLHLIRQRNNA